MKFEKIHNKGQAKLFKNSYVEYLTKTHPLIIWGMYLPIIILLAYYTSAHLNFSWIRLFLLFIAGIFSWTFFEYMVHRYVFHWVSDNPRAQRISYLMHGNHHEFPRDKQRLFMPPVPSLIFSCMFLLLFYAIMGVNSMAFFPGFILGYLIYGSMHYAIHAWSPPFKWMKPIWRNHHLHHYKSEEKGFGVSSPFWDLVFGTQFDLKNEKVNETEVKKLMYQRKTG